MDYSMSQPGAESLVREILGLCAREAGHELMHERLSASLVEFERQSLAWDFLVQTAEQQGIAPLLYTHSNEIGAKLPEQPNRLLRSLFLRSRRANIIRNSVISDLLRQFQHTGIDVLLIKGIALCNYAYSEPGLRPMRDMDLLLKKEDLARAEQILVEHGYEVDEDHDIPADYYHLPPLRKTTDGLPVTIELHHNLLPLNGHYPLWPYEKSSGAAIEIDLNGNTARTLGLEENLWYIYLHGFQAPLTYEPFRFIHVADSVNLVEQNIDTINWDWVQANFPILPIFLSRLHFITPWPAHVVDRLNLPVQDRPGHPGTPFTGWPQRKLNTVGKKESFKLLRDTFWPSQWWVQVYYGWLDWPRYMRARFIQHPRTLWRWVKAYWLRYIRNAH